MYSKLLLLILLIPSFGFAQLKDTTGKIIYTLPANGVDSYFPGGPEGWQNYLTKNMQYPRKAIKNRIQGTITIQFVVDVNGKVTETEAIEGPEILTAEAIRLLNASGKWIPARINNIPVRSYKKQSFVFRFEKE